MAVAWGKATVWNTLGFLATMNVIRSPATLKEWSGCAFGTVGGTDVVNLHLPVLPARCRRFEHSCATATGDLPG